MKEFATTLWTMVKAVTAYVCALVGVMFTIPGYILLVTGKTFGRWYDSIMGPMRKDTGSEIIGEIIDM